MQDKTTPLCKLHPDFHLPANVTVGAHFDGDDYAMRAKNAGADSLAHYAKDHYGHAYYPTTVGTVHPGLSFDMLKAFTDGCRKAGISPTFDYSVFLDTAAVRRHPDWILQHSPDPAEINYARKYLPICVNSGYLEEMLIPQTLELINNYAVDEILYDTMSEFEPCYCKQCQEKFGKPIPLDNTNPDWLTYVQWYIKCYDSFFQRLLDVVHEVNPSVSVVVNWRWSVRIPATPARYVKRLIGDLFTSPSLASYFSRYWVGTGYPFDYMCGRFMHGLGDWSSNTVDTLQATAAATIANGGSFYIIDRELPEGTLEERAYAVVGDVFSFMQERRSVTVDTTPVPETAVLHALECIIGSQGEYFPDRKARTERLQPLTAVSQLFQRGGRHYTALNAQRLNETLDRYKLLILPEADFIDENLMRKMEDFAEKGGAVLIIQSGSTVPVHQGLLALAGVEYAGQTEDRYGYIAYGDTFSNPILARGKFTLVRPKKDTVVRAAYIAPLNSGISSDFGHGFAPPATETEFAAITGRRVGLGQVIYVAAPIFTSFFTHLNPDIATLTTTLYDALLPEPLAKIDHPAHIEISTMRKADDLIVHLVNQSGKETLAAGWCPITEYMPVFENVPIYIRDNGNVTTGTLEPGGIPLTPVKDGAMLRFTIPRLHIMMSCRLAGYFK